MAPQADPYRTLGLTRGATAAEVKQAYRRLAKANHPDAAGEAALPRFLAIQAAYDQLMGPGASAGGTAARPAAPRRPWDADPDRADATRRAYGGRARRPRTGGTRRSAGTGPTAGGAPGGDGAPSGDGAPGGAGAPGGDGAAGGAGTSSGSGPSTGPAAGPSAAGGDASRGSGGRGRRSNKATLGSTSYDGAEAEPFEPDWGGASWYGTTSGTYWTLNPKEYADPRKHGPEYQARARRAAAAGRGEAAPLAGEAPLPGETPPEPDLANAEDPAPTAPPLDPAATPPQPTHTTSSWWDATAGAEATAAPPGASATGTADTLDAAGSASPDPRAPTTAGMSMTSARSAGRTWLDGPRPSWPVRVGRGVVAWLPIALAIGWAGGELSGCARFSATCDGSADALVWLLQVGTLALLVALPALAAPAAVAAIVAIGAAVPTALVLSAPGSEGANAGAAFALGILVVIAWCIGLGVGAWRAVRRASEPLS